MRQIEFIRNYSVKKEKIVCSALFSILFSASYVLGSKISFGTYVYDSFTENYFVDFTWVDLLSFIGIGFACCLLLLFLLLLLTRLQLSSQNKDQFDSKVFILCSIVLLLLAWSPYIYSLAPGSVLGDSLNSIYQILDPSAGFSNHHPITYTLFVGVFLSIGSLVGNINVGIWIYSITQAVIMAYSIAKLLAFLYKKSFPKIAIGICYVYYMFFPLFPTYAVTLWKDPLYSCFLLHLTLMVIDFSLNPDLIKFSAFKVKYSLVCLLVCLFRNNGIYVVVFTTGLILLKSIKSSRTTFKSVAALLLCTIVIYGGTNIFFEKVLKVKNSEFVEKIGIPLQQIAYVINTDGYISETDKTFLFEILPGDQWESSYTPCLVDSIKWNDSFNQELLEANKSRFFRIYIDIVLHNPLSALKAYCLETFGFWKIGVQNDYGYISTDISDNYFGIQFLFDCPRLRNTIQNVKIYIGSGTLFWVIATAGFLCWIKEQKVYMAYFPALGNWLTTMIATPVAFSMRYVYIFALGLPLFCALPFVHNPRSDDNE